MGRRSQSTQRAEYSSMSRQSRASTQRDETPANQAQNASHRIRGPLLASADSESVNQLVVELTDLCATHALFIDTPTLEAVRPSNHFARYKFRSVAAIKRSKRDARIFLLGDLWEVWRRCYPEIAYYN